MGRELKRVPLNFDWPMKQYWKGYINPYRSSECKICRGHRGLSEEAEKHRKHYTYTVNPDYFSQCKGSWLPYEYAEEQCKKNSEPYHCIACNGEGEFWFSKEIETKAEEWWDKEKYDPPEGEGYQLWENTSEGSPTSPVFSTLEELCRWLATNNTSVFADETATYEEWFKMLKEDGVYYEIDAGTTKLVFM